MLQYNADYEKLWMQLQEKYVYLSSNQPRFCVDSRCVRRGDIFVDLHGQKHYVLSAFKQGAVCCITEISLSEHPDSLTISPGRLISFLQYAAAKQRVLWQDKTVIAITGSVGKTTTRCLLHRVLSVCMPGVVWTPDSGWNGQWGVALSILNAPVDSTVVILELGIDRPCSMLSLASIVQPDIALVTNIGPTHLERLGDINGVAKEKSILYSSLKTSGCAVLNANSLAYSVLDKAAAKVRSIVYSTKQKHGDIWLEKNERKGAYERCSVGSASGEVAQFNVSSFQPGGCSAVLALAAISQSLGVSLSRCAAAFNQVGFAKLSGRMQALQHASGTLVLDDAFNASPESVQAALSVCRTRGHKRCIFVFADMLELGANAVKWHVEAADWIASANIAELLTFGELTAHTYKAYDGKKRHFSSMEDLILHVRFMVQHGDKSLILVKGSRSMGLNRLIQALELTTPSSEECE